MNLEIDRYIIGMEGMYDKEGTKIYIKDYETYNRVEELGVLKYLYCHLNFSEQSLNTHNKFDAG